jgi:hypothetical protein
MGRTMSIRRKEMAWRARRKKDDRFLMEAVRGGGHD